MSSRNSRRKPRKTSSQAAEVDNAGSPSIEEDKLVEGMQEAASGPSDEVTHEETPAAEVVELEDDAANDERASIEEVELPEEMLIEESPPSQEMLIEESPPSQEMLMGANMSDEEIKPADKAAKEDTVAIEEEKPAEEGKVDAESAPSEEAPMEAVDPAGEVTTEEAVPDENVESVEAASREEANPGEAAKEAVPDENVESVEAASREEADPGEAAKPAEEHPKEESNPAEQEDVNNSGIDAQEALKQAMDRNDEDAVLKLYATNVHQTDSSGRSLLAWAVSRDFHELIRRLSVSGVVFDPDTIHQDLALSDPCHRHDTMAKVRQLAEHQRVGFCQTHEGRPVQAWCNTCNIPICNMCMGKRGDHKNHDTDADLNACLLDHKDGFLSSLQEVDEGVQALKDQCKIDSSDGQHTINGELGTACAGIDAWIVKHADSTQAQNERDDEEIAKLQARIDELQAAKEERQRQKENFDEQAQAVKSSLGTDAQRHCETVEAWQHSVLEKMDSAAARASTWRKAVDDALASRPEEHIDLVALSALRARKETQSFLAEQENLQMPTFPDAVRVATSGAQSASKSFQEGVDDTISDHSKTEEEKTLAFLVQQKVRLDSLQPKVKTAINDATEVTAVVDDAGDPWNDSITAVDEPDAWNLESTVTNVVDEKLDVPTHALDVMDEPKALAESSSVAQTVIPDFDVGNACECKDANGNWWPVMISAKNGDGTFACVVSDGFNSTWPQVYKENLRHTNLADKGGEMEAPEADATALVPDPTTLAATDSEIEAPQADAKPLVSDPAAPTLTESTASDLNEKVTDEKSQESGAPQQVAAALQQLNSTPSPDPAAALAALPVPDELEEAKSQLEAARKIEEEKKASPKRRGRFGGLLG